MTTDRSPSPSRRSVQSAAAHSRRASTAMSNPDVFSDDYAIDGSPEMSPVDSVQHSSEHLPLSTPAPHRSLPVPTPATRSSRPLSTFKRPIPELTSVIPNRAVSTISHATSSAQRTSSTSSRFSMPRSQSPYVGPTVPSHPYAMYPQVTRASSIASESTIRPLDRAHVALEPTHPYSMYPQNTVSEEEIPIPVGFPGMGTYPRHRTDADVGDIVGVDGHVEELPPYSRYAESTSPKIGTTAPPSFTQEAVSPLSQESDSSVTLNEQSAAPAGIIDEKRGWKAKAHRKVFLGVPCWALLVVIVVVVLAATIGGVIGTVVGQDQSSDAGSASAAAASTVPPAIVSTTTVFLDATPLPSSAVPPDDCPTGQFSINIAGDSPLCSSSCVNSSELTDAWSCLTGGGIDINVSNVIASTNWSLNVEFLSAGSLPPNFTFGAQPPNLTGTHMLQPYGDRDDGDQAMFFWAPFNKVTIWPLAKFPIPNDNMRKRIVQRQYGQTANIGDHVWVCTWEKSVLEFLMYPGQTASWYTASPKPIAASSATTDDPFTGLYTASNKGSSASHTHTWSEGPTATSGWKKDKRQATATTGANPYYTALPQYPFNVKIIEKRNPAPNPATYCQLMLVDADWSLSPITNVPQIFVPEIDFGGSDSISTGGLTSKRWTQNDLKSYCSCEYDNF